MSTPRLHRDKRHDHYWIEDGILFESYWTIRGLRYRSLMKVDLPDCEWLTDTEVLCLEEKYLSISN